MTAVDVAAIRAALEAATPGRLSLTEDELGPRFDREVGGVTVYDVDPADGKADAELIVLLRNNAEALLRMLDDGYCAGYDHGVEDQMDRQEAALAEAERRGAIKALRNLPDHLKPNMSLVAQIDARADAIENGGDH